MFGLCRYCGEQLSRARRPLEVCAKCENSPLCDQCGHPRADHTHVFARGAPVRCKQRVVDFQTLSNRPCDCDGFRPVTGEPAEASFLVPSDESDAPLPPLRIQRPGSP